MIITESIKCTIKNRPRPIDISNGKFGKNTDNIIIYCCIFCFYIYTLLTSIFSLQI